MEATPDPRRWHVLLACCLLMLAVLTVPSLTLAWEPATPRLFGANDLAFRLSTTVPALLLAAIALAGGVIADLTGRRRVLLVGAALFLAGGLTSMLARTELWVVVGRLTMAVGGGLCAPLAMALTRVVFPPGEQARALGIFTAVQGTALVGGPIIAGQISAAFGWRAASLVPLAAALGAGPWRGGPCTIPQASFPLRGRIWLRSGAGGSSCWRRLPRGGGPRRRGRRRRPDLALAPGRTRDRALAHRRDGRHSALRGAALRRVHRRIPAAQQFLRPGPAGLIRGAAAPAPAPGPRDPHGRRRPHAAARRAWPRGWW